jgi:hypothetical protein
MLHRPPAIVAASLPAEISSARALIEATLWQAMPVNLMSIVSLSLGTAEAIIARSPKVEGPVDHWQLFGMQHPAGRRYRDLYRLRAAEMAAALGNAVRLLVIVDESELSTSRIWPDCLEDVLNLLPPGSELGVTLVLPANGDTPNLEAVCREFRSRRLFLAIEEFAGNGKQVMELDKLVPDYLVMADSMLSNLTSAPHTLRRLESVLIACDELAIKPVLPHRQAESTLALCQQIGYDLALRPHTLSPVSSPGIAPVDGCPTPELSLVAS